MKTYGFSKQTGALYFWVGIIFILIAIGLLIGGVIYFIAVVDATDVSVSIDRSNSYSTGYRGHRGSPAGMIIYPIGMVVAGVGLLALGFSMFIKVLRQRFTSFIIGKDNLICTTFGKEIFNIPFEKLGISESQYSAVISDRRDRAMYMVTSDIENYEEFVQILKRNSEGY